MRIAVLSVGSFDTNYSDYHIMRDIIVQLLKNNIDVDLIQKQYKEKPIYPEEFSEYIGNRLHIYNIRFKRKAKTSLKTRYLADLVYYFRACNILKNHVPDKVFLQSNNTSFLPIFYTKHIIKCPIIYNEQDIFPENALFSGLLDSNSIIYRISHFLQRYSYNNATVLSTISEDMKDTIVNLYEIEPNNVNVIYNWGHEELPKRSENAFLAKYPKRKEEFRILYAGNLGKMQNVEIILKAARIMKGYQNVTFFIVGNGANEDGLKKYASDNSLKNVVFVDMQPLEMIADLYASADINIIPLVKKLIYAALPSKIADCLIAGTPIITCFDVESKLARYAVEHGIYNVDPMDEQALAATIESVIISPFSCSYTDILSELFDKKKNSEQYLKLITDCSEYITS